MSAYRSLDPQGPFLLRVRFLPTALGVVIALVAVVLVALPHLLAAPVTISCERADDVGAFRCDVSRLGRSTTVDVPRAYGSGIAEPWVILRPLDDGGGALSANGRELARFRRQEVEAATIAARDLSHALGEAGRRHVAVRVPSRPSPDGSYFVAVALVVVALVGFAYFRPIDFVVDSEERVLVIRRGSAARRISLRRISGVALGVERSLTLRFVDEADEQIGPVALTREGAARCARILREQIERTQSVT